MIDSYVHATDWLFFFFCWGEAAAMFALDDRAREKEARRRAARR